MKPVLEIGNLFVTKTGRIITREDYNYLLQLKKVYITLCDNIPFFIHFLVINGIFESHIEAERNSQQLIYAINNI